MCSQCLTLNTSGFLDSSAGPSGLPLRLNEFVLSGERKTKRTKANLALVGQKRRKLVQSGLPSGGGGAAAGIKVNRKEDQNKTWLEPDEAGWKW